MAILLIQLVYRVSSLDVQNVVQFPPMRRKRFWLLE